MTTTTEEYWQLQFAFTYDSPWSLNSSAKYPSLQAAQAAITHYLGHDAKRRRDWRFRVIHVKMTTEILHATTTGGPGAPETTEPLP